MPATVIPVKGMQLGFVGSVSSEGYPLRVPRQVKATDTNAISFGETVVLNTDNTYSSVKQYVAGGGTPTTSTPIGIAVSNVNVNSTYATNGGQNATGGSYAPGSIADVMVRGTVNVYCANGTPTAGGAVYLRIAANASVPNGVVGGLEAAADSTNSVLIAGLKWKTGHLETDGTAQVSFINQMIP